MSSNTKQSEDTYIRWSMNIKDAIQVGQFTPEPILIIHPDGRVTTSDRLKPTETAALVLDQIKTQWMRDGQATKIMEMQERIKWLEEARTVAAANSLTTMLAYEDAIAKIKRLEESLDKTSKAACKHIKRLESEVYTLRLYGNKDCTAMADQALKEAKL